MLIIANAKSVPGRVDHSWNLATWFRVLVNDYSHNEMLRNSRDGNWIALSMGCRYLILVGLYNKHKFNC